MDLPRDLIDLLAAFADAKVDLVIVGGHAVAFHAVPRAPRNVIDATRRMTEEDIVYLGRPPQRIDLLRRIDGVAAADVFAHAVTTSFAGVNVKIIARGDLIANKKASGRPQDLLDVAALERVRKR